MQRSQILKLLADKLDVNSLLESHPEISQGDVVQSLLYASDLVHEQDNPRIEISNLYRAYNGTMAGLYVGASIFFHIRELTDAHEQTIRILTEFLLTYSNQFKGNARIERTYDNIEEAVEQELRDHDEVIADYYLLGLAVFRIVILHGISAENVEDFEEATRILTKLGHRPANLEKMRQKMRKGYLDGDPTWQDRLTACMKFLRELLIDLDEEQQTCFVALPFKEPYIARYLNFYRTIARNKKMLPFRAWGSLGNEDYQETLLVLVAKSGALLADVTEPNVNVAMEVGFALGQNKPVWLTAETVTWKNISNFKLDWVYPYQVSDDSNWFEEQAASAALYFTALDAAKRPGSLPSWHTEPLEILSYLKNIFEEKKQNV